MGLFDFLQRQQKLPEQKDISQLSLQELRDLRKELDVSYEMLKEKRRAVVALLVYKEQRNG